jgi:MoaA/NifB/PqqE/SkfB family radical SAM enzyme
MYLQITTKCNMKCAHCCYSCTMRGKHMEWSTVVDAIAFARDFDDYSIAIGGGEPTLHPRFFDILKICINDFDYVWMATNGSQTQTMFRLANIIHGEDYVECNCSEEDIENGYCTCHDNGIYQNDKLSVALSQDCFHGEIDERIVKLWRKNANVHRYSHFEIRDVSRNVINQGRAKKTGSGWEDGCACSDIIIRPDGTLKACGCTNAPIVGNIYDGVSEKWEKILFEDDSFRDSNCYNEWKNNRR